MSLPTFGFIAEGVTDFAVLENILVGYFDANDMPTQITRLQPNDENDSLLYAAHGGFSLVITYCQTKEFGYALVEMDFLIIAIDTDTIHDANVVLSDFTTGKRLDVQEIIKNVTQFFELKIKNRFGNDFYEAYRSKIIFAIAVDSIECWLLPLYFTKKEKKEGEKSKKTNNCLRTLREKVTVKKEYKTYDRLSDGFMRQKTLFEVYSQNPSLQIFVENLKAQFSLL